jgi:4-carboxymuconolactone decarboxylase
VPDEREHQGKRLLEELFHGATREVVVPESLRRHTVEHLYGDVWQGPELSLAERALITCTVLVAAGRDTQLRLHLLAARSLGIPRTKLEGLIDHVAHYAGWPTAVGASAVLAEVWPEDDAGR